MEGYSHGEFNQGLQGTLLLTAVSSPDLHLLRVFVAVTESGGFSAAQITLNVSQSTISTQMTELEARLGMKLCHRGRSGFSLTDDGHATYEAAIKLIRNCGDFVAEINARQGTIIGELRVGMADSLVGNPDFPIERVIRRLRDRMPRVKITLSEADPLTIEQQLLSGQLHAGVHVFPNHAPGLRYLKLFTELQDLYCGKGHPLFEIEDEGLTAYAIEKSEYAARTYYGGKLKPGVLHLRSPAAKASTMGGVLALILSGKFIGHLPMQCARLSLDEGAIRPILPGVTSYHALFECAFAAGARGNRQLAVFEDVLGSHYLDGGANKHGPD